MNNSVYENYLSELNAQQKPIGLTKWSVIKIKGDQSGAFLQGQFTADVSTVSESHGCLSALCNHQGRVLATFYLMQQGDCYLCILPSSLVERFINHLSKFAVFSRVQLEPESNTFIYAFIGAGSIPKLQRHCSTIPAQAFAIINQPDSHVLRLDSSVPAFLVVSYQQLEPQYTEDSVVWDLFNILMGNAIIINETQECFTPHMLNLHLKDAISFQKGCYVGQEIIARTHYLGKSKRHLCLGVASLPGVIKPGAKIEVSGQEAGVVVNVISYQSTMIMLAVLQEPLDRTFTLSNQSLEMVHQLTS